MSRVAPRLVCEVAIRVVSSLVRHRAEVTTAFAADTPDVIANQSRLGQVVINLIVNASQARTALTRNGIASTTAYCRAHGRSIGSEPVA